ncbi:AraC family transcriptional regulator [Litoreibacter roseus]|uniref:DNA-binding transcriptional regulator ChbR n=1 Tax=Litoreibacter roseus TaxID=2601869 RepID=A0A6N6JGJ8_9RHOB|nr:AraC family transcriptional regulator [Litoreibacter roseus]GFE64960.1 DNA-binding transcriptional regulator ChbR [Litoreibacter roseus]
MKIKTFQIDDYIAKDDAFHIARKSLATRFPPAAHGHDYYEIFLIEDGATAHWVNGKRETLLPGHLVFIRPDDAHAFKADKMQGCRIINVMFKPKTVRHLRSRYPDEVCGKFFDTRGPYPETHMLAGPDLARVTQALVELQTAPRALAYIEHFILMLATRVLAQVHPVRDTAPKWFTDACRAAQNPAVFRRGAAGLIDAAGRSHEHVCRTSRMVLGLTPSAYVNKLRLDHGARMLSSSELPIEEVARDCGIENISHFYRLFRLQFGLTPRQYRLRHQRDPFEVTAHGAQSV